MSDKSLRSKIIRLAHQKPELRKHLLPLVTDKVARNDVQVGDFFTDGDYFLKVLATSGKSTLSLISVGGKAVKTKGQMRLIVPDDSRTKGKPFTRRMDTSGGVKGEYGGYYRKWDGKPEESLDSQFRG